jgi:hypothetical protein
MTDASPPSSGSSLHGTVAPGREHPGVGIVWLERLSLVASDGWAPSVASPMAVLRSGSAADGGRAATVGAIVEVPLGHLVVDVRVGYARAASSFASELRFVDLAGHRKSALVLLERRQVGDNPAESVFVDPPTAAAGKRTFLSIRASVVEHADHVRVRGLRLSVSRA